MKSRIHCETFAGGSVRQLGVLHEDPKVARWFFTNHGIRVFETVLSSDGNRLWRLSRHRKPSSPGPPANAARFDFSAAPGA